MIVRRGRRIEPIAIGLDLEMTHEIGTRFGGRSVFQEPWRPPTEVFECNGVLIIRVEIAGLKLQDFTVVVMGEELLVRGERASAHHTTPTVYHESRIRYGAFEAIVRLPFPVAIDDASAEYIDGLLSVRLPRRGAAKVQMRDDVQAHAMDRGEG